MEPPGWLQSHPAPTTVATLAQSLPRFPICCYCPRIRHSSVAEQPVKAAPCGSKKAKAKSPSTVSAGLAELNAEQLRKLCAAQDIKWRNANGKGKHLSKAEMIAVLTA